jgi:uncharacterized membrane protein YczE
VRTPTPPAEPCTAEQQIELPSEQVASQTTPSARFQARQSEGSTGRRRLTARVVQLYLGLMLYGLSSALQVRSQLGLDPWDVLHQGIARHLGIAIGTVSIVVGAVVLLGWLPIRQRPGFGTLSNVVMVGLSLNVALTLLPTPREIAIRCVMMAGAILLCAVATGLYISAELGPGPRDGLMTGWARRTGRSIRLTRTVIELVVLVAGWLLGGSVGVGTLLFAISIGPLTQLFLRLFARSREPGQQAGSR